MRFADLAEADAFLAAHPDVQRIELFIIDPCGVPRGKLLHRDELRAIYTDGRPLPSSILGLTIRGEDVDATGLVWDVADADCWAFPLPGSLQLQTWRRPATAQVQVSMHPARGLPASLADPRHVLARAIERLQAAGYHPVMAAELEFYLLDAKRDAAGHPQPAAFANGERPQAPQVYGVLELERLDAFLDDLYRACEAGGLPVRTAISEYAPGQLEITLQHRHDALQAMDEAVRYKRLVRGVALSHGLQACFMAKPFAELAGSGLHLHASLADAEGRNLFACEVEALERGDGDGDGAATLLRQSVAGLLDTLADGLALFCPNANSYRRFQANSYAPLARNWGINNRTVSLRVPGGPAASRHIEHRICGADANPYLAAALVLHGMLRGLTLGLEPGAPVTGNGYAQTGERLGCDWRQALGDLEHSAWTREALGEDFHRVYLAIKQAEYAQFMGEVGEQDWRWYLGHA
jgi:glutamine synthetase